MTSIPFEFIFPLIVTYPKGGTEHLGDLLVKGAYTDKKELHFEIQELSGVTEAKMEEWLEHNSMKNIDEATISYLEYILEPQLKRA